MFLIFLWGGATGLLWCAYKLGWVIGCLIESIGTNPKPRPDILMIEDKR